MPASTSHHHTFLPSTASPTHFPSPWQAYTALVKGARSQRLEEALAQTESCFKSFAAKLGLAHLPAAAPSPSLSHPVDGGSGGGSGGSPAAAATKAGCGWAALAERVLAQGIEEQPALLKAIHPPLYLMPWCPPVLDSQLLTAGRAVSTLVVQDLSPLACCPGDLVHRPLCWRDRKSHW